MQSTQRRVRLDAVMYGSQDVNLYRFVCENGDALPGASPGSHIDVKISDNFTRSYSLINSGETLDHYLIGVRRDELGRGGSKCLHDEARVGRVYLISEPRNNFELQKTTEPVVLLAGGIGITPMLSMYRELKEASHPVELRYWARDADSFLFRDELANDPNVRLIAAPGKPEPGEDVATAVSTAPAGSHLYCCGPAPMLDEFLTAAASHHPDHVHIERFSPVLVDTETPAAETFEVELARSKLRLTIGPDDTILQSCLARGIDVDYSCEEGTCGACESKVLAGTVTHRDAVRTPEEHDDMGTMMICCSRSGGGDLTLDL